MKNYIGILILISFLLSFCSKSEFDKINEASNHQNLKNSKDTSKRKDKIGINNAANLFSSNLEEIEVIYQEDPSGYCPLCFQIIVAGNNYSNFELTIKGKNGNGSNLKFNRSYEQAVDTFQFLGLYANYANEIEVKFYDQSNLIHLENIQTVTNDFTFTIPDITVLEVDTFEMQEGLTLVSFFGGAYPHTPFIFDNFGEIRWYLDYTSHNLLYLLIYDNGIERLQNGNFYFADNNLHYYYEIDLVGHVINHQAIPTGHNFHHNIFEKPDSNFLITTNKLGDLHLNGNFTVEDHIIEVERFTGNLIHDWDLKYVLDEYRTTLSNNLSNSHVDWVHCNAVIYDANDNTIIVSGKDQGVFKIGYDDELKWLLAPHKGWNVNRNGDSLKNYLLDPIDAYGNYLNDSVKMGYSNHPEFEWNWYQHAPLVMPNGNVMLFDNGHFRNFSPYLSGYSRAVEYEIDAINKTVKQVWQYGKERGGEGHSSVVSDVDYNLESNNVIFAPGYNTFSNGIEVGGRIIELDYTSKQVVFEALIDAPYMDFYRVERMRFD